MEWCFMFSCFNGAGGVFVFQVGAASILSGGGGAPWGGRASVLVRGGFEKNHKMRAVPPAPHPPTKGNPVRQSTRFLFR